MPCTCCLPVILLCVSTCSIYIIWRIHHMHAGLLWRSCICITSLSFPAIHRQLPYLGPFAMATTWCYISNLSVFHACSIWCKLKNVREQNRQKVTGICLLEIQKWQTVLAICALKRERSFISSRHLGLPAVIRHLRISICILFQISCNEVCNQVCLPHEP